MYRAAWHGVLPLAWMGLLGCASACAPTGHKVEPAEPPPEHEALAAEPAAVGGITREEQDLIPPGPPGTLRVERAGGTYSLEWRGTGDDTIRGYQVYRRRPRGEWQAAGFVALRADDARNRATYTYQEPSGDELEFTVASVDARGVPGPKTAEIH